MNYSPTAERQQSLSFRLKEKIKVHNRFSSKKDDDVQEISAELNETSNHRRQEDPPGDPGTPPASKLKRVWNKIKKTVAEYGSFMGPGFMISVAYMDPGNYSTDIAAGAQFRFKLLFVIFLSNCIAVYLQSMAVKLGTVTGRDLAQISRDELPRWLNYCLYILAEIAIICTDIAEVIGTAIALNILLHIPLIAGVVITIVDVMIVLLAHRPGRNSMRIIRIFEFGVALLVLGVVICFAVMLARIPPTSARDVFLGFVPSPVLVGGDAIYASCGILGATVMPHSLYLGSSIVKPRLINYDVDNGNVDKALLEDIEEGYYDRYRPSLSAIKWSMKYSLVELAVSLFTFALFVNSAILIVAGSSIFGTDHADDADLYAIYHTLQDLLARGAGTVFMLALLLSGQSAGIICTIAGQIVSEGYMNWKMKPWKRRIFTRSIAIVPCLIVAGAVGQSGLNQTLNASQVALSILLPFLVAPLVYFTCKASVMTIPANASSELQDNIENIAVVTSNVQNEGVEQEDQIEPTARSDINRDIFRAGKPLTEPVSFRNNWFTMILGICIWLFIAILNVYLIVALGQGKS